MNQVHAVLVVLLFAVVVLSSACGGESPTFVSPLPHDAHGSASGVKVAGVTPSPTNTPSPTSTATATATPTPAPTSTDAPAPTQASPIMGAYPPGGTYSPDVFKIMATAPCMVFSSGGSNSIALVAIVGAESASVSAVYADETTQVVERDPVGVYSPGWHTLSLGWTAPVQPSFVWLTADIGGVLYVSDWCAIASR